MRSGCHRRHHTDRHQTKSAVVTATRLTKTKRLSPPPLKRGVAVVTAIKKSGCHRPRCLLLCCFVLRRTGWYTNQRALALPLKSNALSHPQSPRLHKSVLAGLGAARIRAHASAVKNPRTKFCNARSGENPRVYDKHPMNAAPKPPNYVILATNCDGARNLYLPQSSIHSDSTGLRINNSKKNVLQWMTCKDVCWLVSNEMLCVSMVL